MDPKLYKIKDSGYFRTGRRACDGSQFLIGPQGNDLVCLRFSAEGALVDLQTRAILNAGKDGAQNVDAPQWMDDLEGVWGAIEVGGFRIPGREIEIRDIPRYLEEFIEPPSAFPEDRRGQLQRCVADWMRSGNFVLIWDEEYEMNREGEVEST